MKRKPINHLTVQDLEDSVCWAFVSEEELNEGEDETFMMPVNAGAFPESSGIVSATFSLADGSKMIGYCANIDEGSIELGDLQPVIVTPYGQVGFWCGAIEPSPSELRQNYEWLERGADRIFPISFVLQKSSQEQELPTIRGFIVLDDFSTNQTRVVH